MNERMQSWPEILLPLCRVLQAIADPVNVHSEPLPSDLDMPADFYFNGGACSGITGGDWYYRFADGSEAWVSTGLPFQHGGTMVANVRLACGRTVSLGEVRPSAP